MTLKSKSDVKIIRLEGNGNILYGAGQNRKLFVHIWPSSDA